MNLPSAPDQYDRLNESQLRDLLRRADAANHKKGVDLELGVGCRIILTSPDGNRWAKSVDNAGAWVTTGPL